jgi:hypothetical protein
MISVNLTKKNFFQQLKVPTPALPVLVSTEAIVCPIAQAIDGAVRPNTAKLVANVCQATLGSNARQVLVFSFLNHGPKKIGFF